MTTHATIFGASTPILDEFEMRKRIKLRRKCEYGKCTKDAEEGVYCAVHADLMRNAIEKELKAFNAEDGRNKG